MIAIIGYILQLISGLFVALIYFGTWMDWVPFFGFFLAMFTSPGILIFPLFFWFIEGHLPELYIIMWAIGLVGTGIVKIGSSEKAI